MPYQGRSLHRSLRPPGLWHNIPPWVRAAAIIFDVLAVMMIANGLGAAVFAATGFTLALVCYAIQVLAYALNGVLAGWQADLTPAACTSVRLGSGAKACETICRNSSSRAHWQVCCWVSWMLAGADLIASAGLGALGGAIHDRLLSAPGRR
jgi:hypothetical protein